mmetsp:Transcript_122250/g.260875  ORF Transcript_122250/g.260875 Transcript_122250/m.260875 type:complete len:213 (-) Transcript_122250:380-1018(-)
MPLPTWRSRANSRNVSKCSVDSRGCGACSTKPFSAWTTSNSTCRSPSGNRKATRYVDKRSSSRRNTTPSSRRTTLAPNCRNHPSNGICHQWLAKQEQAPRKPSRPECSWSTQSTAREPSCGPTCKRAGAPSSDGWLPTGHESRRRQTCPSRCKIWSMPTTSATPCSGGAANRNLSPPGCRSCKPTHSSRAPGQRPSHTHRPRREMEDGLPSS